MLKSHEVIVKRNIFYRKFYRGNIVLLFLLLVGIGVNIFLYKKFLLDRDTPAYFLADKNSFYIRDYALDLPLYNDEDVESWAKKALEEIYNINYIDYLERIEKSKGLFTPLGYKKYIRSLAASRNLYSLRANQQAIITEFLTPLKVANKVVMSNGTSDGKERYQWLMAAKVRHNYVSSENLENPTIQDLNVSVVVSRESFYDYENGLAISVIIGEAL